MKTIKLITSQDVKEIVREVTRRELGRAKDRAVREIMQELKFRTDQIESKIADDTDSVEILPLSVRAQNVLQNMDVRTIGELCKKTGKEVLLHKNCGTVTCGEIKWVLSRFGRRLAKKGAE